jgi:beta-ribofuranosylaminobenzene 5'-phosphate synthase
MLEKLTFVVHSRLHLTLLGMHAGEYRMNGGIGFSIKSPCSQLVFTKSDKFEIDDLRSRPINLAEQERLSFILETERVKKNFDIAFKVSIEGNMLTHSGFGSGTAITLACVEVLYLLNDYPTTQEMLIQASGRGGTSGVGIYTYFDGGGVFDLGKPIDRTKHLPSSLVESRYLPLLLDQFVMPEWDIGICIPRNIPNKSQTEEQEFFKRVCPISANSVYETTYHTLFGLYAALKENNKAAFCAAIKAIQGCMWKRLEREEYGQGLMDLETSLYLCGAEAVGMSSLGPSLFFLAENVNDVIVKMNALFVDCELFVTQPENQGRIVKYD